MQTRRSWWSLGAWVGVWLGACGEKAAPAPSTNAASAPASAEVQAPRPVERQLFAEKLSASSFLHQEDNLPRDRYHPNYLVDGDPATVWSEGAAGSGAGEWVRIPLSPLASVHRVRLRLWNGYQKSDAVFAANARAKTIEVELLPGGQKKTFSLEDRQDAQEFSFEVAPGPLEGLTLKVLEVYEGKKYKDLCLSELEIFVTTTDTDTTAQEKQKRESLLAWIEEQKPVVHWKESPLLASYREEELGEIANARAYSGMKGTEQDERRLSAALAYFPEESRETIDKTMRRLKPYLQKPESLPASAPATNPAKGPVTPSPRPVRAALASASPAIEENPWFALACAQQNIALDYDLDRYTRDTIEKFWAPVRVPVVGVPCADGFSLLTSLGVRVTPLKSDRSSLDDCGLSYLVSFDEDTRNIVEIETSYCTPFESERELSTAIESATATFDTQGRLRFFSSAVHYVEFEFAWFGWGDVRGRSMITDVWYIRNNKVYHLVGDPSAEGPRTMPASVPASEPAEPR